MVKTFRAALLAACALPLAIAAHAGSAWDVPTVTLDMRGIHDSELFPGSPLSTPDKGGQLTGALDTGRRLSKTTKLGLGFEGGGQMWNHFSEASYGWGGVNATVRAGGTQLRADLEWTPRRLKFPADLDGGEFSRIETRVGVRQAVTNALRVRAELRHQDDDFVTTYDVRDGSTHEGYAQASLRASDRVTLRADVLAGRTRTTSRKYGHSDRVVGGVVATTFGPWRLDGGAWSGLQRYVDAQSGDSNFRRRDQWIQLRGELRRQLSPALGALAAVEWTEQNSSRLGRDYERTTLSLGLTWTVAGE